MKFLKVLAIIIVVLAVIIVVGGFFLPKTYSVSRSAVINAPDSVLYKNISDFNEFLTWNPWMKKEPSAKTVVSGTPSQPGHKYTWEGKETGSGSMTIKTVTPNSLIDIDLRFVKPFESQADTKFAITADGTGNKVTWTMSGENNLMGKWMCLFMDMDSMVGKDFEEGLKSLKEKSEMK
jgi:hypothetical protein